ncbi:RHS repeat protein [Massilia sp. CCM 8692]|uniref:RHS repeat protein n=2 Tax=Massilia rubra TaxID=2607910 RepID=A0ABX0M212_9BURK|nr:RHS repeat protein [Massilia rubra]
MTTNLAPNSWTNFNDMARKMQRRDTSASDQRPRASDQRLRHVSHQAAGSPGPIAAAGMPVDPALRLVRGYPVNPISGCKLLACEIDLDFALPAALPLRWQRIYSSGQRKTGLLGQGWSTPLSDTLHISDGQLIILDPFQRDITFALPRAGEALYSLTEKITLERTGERNFELTDADGLRKQFAMLPRAYDSAVLVGMVDANDNRISIAWNARQLPETVQDSAGRVFVMDYIAHRGQVRLGSVSVQRDAVDYEEPTTELVMQYKYDELGNLFQVIDRAGNVTRQFAYMNHIMIEHAQPGALVSRYEYDEYEWTGKVTRNWANNGMSWNFRYLTGETLVYDHLGREELFRFDKKHRFTGMVDALGGETVRHLDSHGNMVGIVAPGGPSTIYRYDRRSRLMRMESNGKGTGIVYDAKVDKPALITDALGAITALRYDERGNLLSVTDALGNRTDYQYNEHGLPVKVTDAAGGVELLAYNRAAQPVSYTDCSGNTSHFSYDVDGKLLRWTDAQGNATSYTYDAAGRVTTTVHPDGATEAYEYDALGRLLAHTDAAGKRTSYVLDVDGKLLKRIDARGGVLEYRYDGARRLAGLINENGDAHLVVYDALDRMVEETGFDARLTRYLYSDSGLLAAKEELDNGVRTDTSYTRNSAGQVIDMFITRVAGDANAEQTRQRFTYDDLGRMTQAISADAIVALEYDALGQLVSEQRESGGETRVLRHQYDTLGNRTRTVGPDGPVLDKLPDASAHPRPNRRIQGALANTFHHDPMGPMLSQVAGQIVTGEGALPATERNDEYDQTGNLLAMDDKRKARMTDWHDVIGRILSAVRPKLDE